MEQLNQSNNDINDYQQVYNTTSNMLHQYLDTPDFPLFDEVNELLEKEETLHMLQLKLQEREQNQWKERYDRLVQHLNHRALANDSDIEALYDDEDNSSDETNSEDEIDDIMIHRQRHKLRDSIIFSEGNHSSKNTIPVIDAVYLLTLLSANQKVLDLSHKDINDIDVIRAINKFLISREMIAKCGVEVLIMHHCELEDSKAEGLLNIFARTTLQAIDMSFNYLSLEFQRRCFTVLKNLQSTPAYILFHGNVNYAKRFPSKANATKSTSTSRTQNSKLSTNTNKNKQESKESLNVADIKPCENIVDCLSVSTWSISLSLPDIIFVDSRKDTSKDSIYKIPSITLQCQKFLKLLHRSLESKKTISNIIPRSTSKTSAVTQKNKLKKDDNVDTFLTSKRDGLQKLGVLQLSHAKIRNDTIPDLKKCLYLLQSSLIDLDLSFAFLGFEASSMLRVYLESPKCQLIRLGLIGNALGNRGLFEIAKGVQNNQTLISLDLRSNEISECEFLESLCHFSRNYVLYNLFILDGSNEFTANGVSKIIQYIFTNGMILQLPSTKFKSIIESFKTKDEVYHFPFKIVSKAYIGNYRTVFNVFNLQLNCLFNLDNLSCIETDDSTLRCNIQVAWRPSSSSYQSNRYWINSQLLYHVTLRYGNQEIKLIENKFSAGFIQFDSYSQEFNWTFFKIPILRDEHSKFYDILSMKKPTSSELVIQISSNIAPRYETDSIEIMQFMISLDDPRVKNLPWKETSMTMEDNNPCSLLNPHKIHYDFF